MLDDLACAEVGAVLLAGDAMGDATVTYPDFIAMVASTVSHRAAHRAPQPGPPRGFPVKSLKEAFSVACNDFDRFKPKSNAHRMSLRQWCRLAESADLLNRRVNVSAAAIVFARCRRGNDLGLSLEQFVHALAIIAPETGKSFETAASNVGTCPAVTGGDLLGAPTSPSSGTNINPPFKTPGKVHPPNPGLRPKTPRGNPFAAAAGKMPGTGAGTRPKTPGAHPRVATAGASAPHPGTALEAVLMHPTEELFSRFDGDGDGLLSPEEIVSVLVGGPVEDEDTAASAETSVAVELVTAFFDDVDLDRDGRVSFNEFTVFCKKAQRVIRRRGIATVSGTGKAAVPPKYAKDRELERLFAAYCYLGAARPAAGGKAMMDERRFLRLLKEAKLLGGPKMQNSNAQLCFSENRGKNERRLDFRTFLAALGSVASHMGTPYDDVAAAVKSLPAHEKPGTSRAASSEGSVPRVPSFMAPLKKDSPDKHAENVTTNSSGGKFHPVDGSFGHARESREGFAFGSPTKPTSARRATPERKDAPQRTPPSRARTNAVSPSSSVKASPAGRTAPADADGDATEDDEPRPFEANFEDNAAPFEGAFVDAPAAVVLEAETVDAPAEALAAFDRRAAEAPTGADGTLSLDGVRLALSDIAGLNGASAGAVGEALDNAFNDIDVDFTGSLRRHQLGILLRRFHADVAAAAAAGQTLVPPAPVPPMSKPQADAITGVFSSTCKPGSSAVTRDEFMELIAAAGLCGDGAGQSREMAVDVTYARCVSGKDRGEMDFRSFVTALAALAGERGATFFQVAAPVVDAAMQLQARKGKDEAAVTSPGEGGEGADKTSDEGFEANFDDAPPPPPAAAAAPGGAVAELSPDERALWNQEFSSYDEDGSGMIDIECLSFALAKLRLLEEMDVEQAAADLESKLVEVDTECVGEFTFEDFIVFANSLRALARSPGVKPSAKPVPVQREYVFNQAHPFMQFFNDVAPSGEIDGEAFSALLKEAGLVDSKTLTDTGVDVIFARAKARHPGAGRHVPYRIFLGALSLTAGHLGVGFAAVVDALLKSKPGHGPDAGARTSARGGAAEVPAVVPAIAPVGSPPPAATPTPEKKEKKPRNSRSGVMSFFIKPKTPK